MLPLAGRAGALAGGERTPRRSRSQVRRSLQSTVGGAAGGADTSDARPGPAAAGAPTGPGSSAAGPVGRGRAAGLAGD
eukprot:1507914-Alexandrium_andersonii.AAC.1